MYWADRESFIPAAVQAAGRQASADESTSIHSSASTADISMEPPKTESAAAAAEAVTQSQAELLDVQDAAIVQPSQQQQQQQQEPGLAEKAVRLSFAALQGVPEESPKVRRSAWPRVVSIWKHPWRTV